MFAMPTTDLVTTLAARVLSLASLFPQNPFRTFPFSQPTLQSGLLIAILAPLPDCGDMTSLHNVALFFALVATVLWCDGG